jgi:hypothetical protein
MRKWLHHKKGCTPRGELYIFIRIITCHNYGGYEARMMGVVEVVPMIFNMPIVSDANYGGNDCEYGLEIPS